MGTPMRMATYALALVVVFIAAMEIGVRVRPWAGAATETATSAQRAAAHPEDAAHQDGDTGTDSGAQPAARQPDGLAATVDGYQLTLLTPRPDAGPDTDIRLLISGPDGAPVTSYETAHGKQLHLIVVRRDLAGFQHVHPVLDPVSGVWTTSIDTSEPGTYRVFADAVPAGHDGLTLGTDLAVAGVVEPAPPAGTDRRVADLDGYRVELTGDLQPGRTGTLVANVSEDGRPVSDLDVHLEAYGHLVALRQSDLAYLHVHPNGHPGDGSSTPGPSIEFAVDVPTTGVYRLFLDFSHDGVVRTAPFVLVVS